MILSHFSEKPFQFDSKRTYEQVQLGVNTSINPPNSNSMKPRGLWLSDESDYGWKKWCESEEFRIHALEHEAAFKVDVSDVLVLNTDKKIKQFKKEYSIPIHPNISFVTVCSWYNLPHLYKGIVITPYSWRLRLEPGYLWYYGWDCASGCIWDLSCLTELSSSPAQESRLISLNDP